MTITVTIGSDEYPSYISVEDADTYENGILGANATAYRAADADTKGRGLATGYLDINRLSFIDGAWTNTDFLALLPSANAEYAAALIEGSYVDYQTQLSSNQKIVKAGSVMVQYFRVITIGGPAVTLPGNVYAILKAWLAGSASAAVGLGKATGVDACSEFKYDYRQGF